MKKNILTFLIAYNSIKNHCKWFCETTIKKQILKAETLLKWYNVNFFLNRIYIKLFHLKKSNEFICQPNTSGIKSDNKCQALEVIKSVIPDSEVQYSISNVYVREKNGF